MHSAAVNEWNQGAQAMVFNDFSSVPRAKLTNISKIKV